MCHLGKIIEYVVVLMLTVPFLPFSWAASSTERTESEMGERVPGVGNHIREL